MYNLIAYLIYLSVALTTVLLVGRPLFRNGRFFLIEIFESEQTADQINRLLYVGYCLVNTGCAFFHLNSLATLNSSQQLIEYIASSCGELYLIIGIMHFLNLLIVPRIKPFLKQTSSIHLKNQQS